MGQPPSATAPWCSNAAPGIPLTPSLLPPYVCTGNLLSARRPRSWLVWSFFCAYLFTGGFFNILLHLQLYHRWRCAGRRGSTRSLVLVLAAKAGPTSTLWGCSDTTPEVLITPGRVVRPSAAPTLNPCNAQPRENPPTHPSNAAPAASPCPPWSWPPSKASSPAYCCTSSCARRWRGTFSGGTAVARWCGLWPSLFSWRACL